MRELSDMDFNGELICNQLQKNKYVKIFNIIFIILIGQVSYAQTITIIDKDSKFPIQNVHVNNEDRTVRVISDKNGVIDLSVFSDMELLNFSHVSYVELEALKKQLLSGDNTISLQYKSELLNEVFLSATKGEENISAEHCQDQ